VSGMGRRLASALVSTASRLLPPHMAPWARAMARELVEIPGDRTALLFAAGCLRAAAAVAIGAWFRAVFAAVRPVLFPGAFPLWSLTIMNGISARPRLLGLICGALAVAMGMAYMLAAGAPSRYILVNFAALALGTAAWIALGRTARSPLAGAGTAILALSAPLLVTALFGAAAEGASRWVHVGSLSLQVSLIVLPAMIILYARRPDAVGTAGTIAAALALAVQPDRAMAGVLAVALIAFLLARPGRLPGLAAAASLLAFGWTLSRPDRLPATAHVDGVLYTAFGLHPLAGAAVVAGAAALVVPALAGLRGAAGDRPLLLAFGACWSAVVAAAALGNYPTPLVGYGGSAVLGYLLSVALLPGRAGAGRPRAAASPRAAGPEADSNASELSAARPA
jgi:hypothetical protein